MSISRNAAIGFTYAVLYGALSGIAVAVGVAGCGDWNKPHPIVPEPGLPCGRIYHQCPVTGGCCHETEVCRPGGYCAFVGYGAGPDGGTETRQLTPEEARRR